MGKIFSQLISAQLENRTSDYSSGTRGRIWMRTDTSPVVAKFDDGSAIRTLVTTDNTQTLTGKTLTSPTLTTPSVDIPLFSHQTTPSNPSAGSVKAYFKNDDTLYYLNSSGTETTVATTATVAPDQSYEISNLSFTTSVAGGALTIALKGKDGNNPSGSNIVGVGFRSSTVTSGVYVRRTVTSALSIDVTSTATLGFVSGSVAQYVYVYLLDNAGTVELAVSGSVFDEGTVKTSTSMSAAADSRTVLYSTTGRTSKAIRLIGRIKFTLATAGTWDETGDELSLVPFFAPTDVTVAARYDLTAGTANSAVANGATEIIDFDTSTYDTHSAVTVGASWKFTAPLPGIYSVSCYSQLASFSDGTYAQLEVYKNGSVNASLSRAFVATGGSNVGPSGSVCLSLEVGDYVDVRLTNGDSSSRSFATAASTNWVCIERVGTN